MGPSSSGLPGGTLVEDDGTLAQRLFPSGSGVRCASEPGAGLGLVAERHFKKDEVLWRERPLMAIQHRYNQRCVASCAECYRILAARSPREEMDHLLREAGVDKRVADFLPTAVEESSTEPLALLLEDNNWLRPH